MAWLRTCRYNASVARSTGVPEADRSGADLGDVGGERRVAADAGSVDVAGLAPFVVWAMSGGSIPLGLTVLQVLAPDIDTDLLPALALGAEKPNPRTMPDPARTGNLIDRGVVRRAFAVLGPVEAVLAMLAFLRRYWRLPPAPRLLLYAVAFEVAMLATFLLAPPLPGLLGGSAPSAFGWTLAALAVRSCGRRRRRQVLRARGRRSPRPGS